MFGKKNLKDKINSLQQNSLGILVREIITNEEKIYILYIPQITDKKKLCNFIIKPLIEYNSKKSLTIDYIASSIIFIDDICIDNDENKIVNYVLKGNSVIIMPESKQYISANTIKIEKRSIQSPEIQSSLKAPKDAFTENFETNLSLIHYRIKDPSLHIDKFTVGKRTKTSIAVIYIDDIANSNYVNQVKQKIEKTNIDGIVESGYVQKFLLNSPFKLFPQIGIMERSDGACASLLKGKVCVIVEGSNLALIMPQTFIEFLDSGDDHYDNIYLSIFSKFLRILALITSLSLAALYVALVGFHADTLPPQYILALAASRITVPFNALIEATLMEGVAELLREASIRLPKQIGPAIGIVGTIVIGQAAVAAGLVSPLMVIIVSLSTMSSFSAPDYTIISPFRILKFGMIFITGIFGLFGFVMGFTIIIINLISTTSFGIPYLAPFSPFIPKDIKDYTLSNITTEKKRPKFLNTRDNTRQ